MTRFAIALWRAFRTLIPAPHDRVPLTLSTAPYACAYFIPFIFLCYLVRRPDTRVIRILLLPLLITTSLQGAFGYVWTDPRLNVYNWGAALASFAVIAKGLDAALASKGRFKQGEKGLGDMEEPAIAKKEGVDEAPGDTETKKRPGSTFLPRWLEDALEFAFAFRGIGWDFGKGVYLPPPTRPLEKGPFVRATLLSFVVNYVGLDFMESLLKQLPGVGSVRGGTIFYPWMEPLPRYLVSTLIHFSTGCALLCGFAMVYDLITLFAVLLLDHSPTAWPPVMDNPWIADSLHDFWAKRWHQLLRQTFLVLGGIPGRVLFGNIGLVFGTFLASGMFHECTIYALGRGWDGRVPLFFLLQGGAVIGERLWRRWTGRRVGGWFGTLWVYFDIVILGQPLSECLGSSLFEFLAFTCMDADC